MAWFQLDPQSIADRVEPGARIPSRAVSLARGMVGFTLLSVAGFVPWAAFGRPLYRALGEAGMYAVCAAVFIAFSGPLLHRLILGRGSMGRFYAVFSVAFVVYSIGWTVGWMLWRGHPGSVAGLLAGTAGMGWVLARAFGSGSTLKLIGLLFAWNAAGYFIGGVSDAWIGSWRDAVGPEQRATVSMLAHLGWGLCYGLGFGAGLGLAFYHCQSRARERIAERRTLE